MDDEGSDRIGLRRRTHDLNDRLDTLLADLAGHQEAESCVRRARAALFEAWTLLCVPPEEDEDD